MAIKWINILFNHTPENYKFVILKDHFSQNK